MPARQLDLLLDQVKIIEEPLRRGRHASGWINRERRAVEIPQHFLVAVQLREQLVGAASDHDLMLGREGRGMTRELFDAKQLGDRKIYFAGAFAGSLR